MDLSTIVREEAGKRLGSEAEVKAFVEGFEKQAIQFPSSAAGKRIMIEAIHAFGPAAVKSGLGIGAALLGVAAVKGINSASSVYTNNVLQSKFDSALTDVKANNKIVRGANPTRVDSYAKTLFSFAPHVASDPNLLTSLLSNAVLGEGLDPITIKSVVDLEARYKENNSHGPLTGIRAV